MRLTEDGYVVDRFDGTDYAFLSNFYPSPIVLPQWHAAAGQTAQTVEHAFQSAKTEAPHEARMILAANSPGVAKRLGRRVAIRDGWDEGRVSIMLGLLRLKFALHSDLSLQLLNTRYAYLVEGNTWGDYFWGQVDGRGSNMLGKLLMLVRAELDVATFWSPSATAAVA
jgi:ribA/ribD-fused uncharacterized protein